MNNEQLESWALSYHKSGSLRIFSLNYNTIVSFEWSI